MILLALLAVVSISAEASHLGAVLVKNPSFEVGWNNTSSARYSRGILKGH